MRQSDQSKLRGRIQQSNARLDQNTKLGHRAGTNTPVTQSGTALVKSAVAYSVKGSLCAIEVLNQGVGTGLVLNGAVCYASRLRPGDTVQYVKHTAGRVELIAGGGGGAVAVPVVPLYLIPLHDHSGPRGAGLVANGILHGSA